LGDALTKDYEKIEQSNPPDYLEELGKRKILPKLYLV
jgi:hypothetical protein